MNNNNTPNNSPKKNKQENKSVNQKTIKPNNTPKTNVSNSLTKTSNSEKPVAKNDIPKQNQYKFKLFDYDIKGVSGLFPIMVKIPKLLEVLKSKNIKVTPKNSYNLLGEFVNRYNPKIENTNEEKVLKYKYEFQLNNNYQTILDFIKLFSHDSITLSPKAIINCINSIIMYYNDSNKKSILMHLSYLAEVLYNHFSMLENNKEIDRNDFFSSSTGLDINSVLECAEFYYTDLYMLNSKEKEELITILKTYYLEEVSAIKEELNKSAENTEILEKELAKEKEEEESRKKQEEEELKKKKEAENKKDNEKGRKDFLEKVKALNNKKAKNNKEQKKEDKKKQQKKDDKKQKGKKGK